MASKSIIPKHDLELLIHAKVGDHVGTRYGEAKVTKLMKVRASYALKHWNDNE